MLDSGNYFSRRYGTKADSKDIPEMQHNDYISLSLDPESDLDLTGKGSSKPLLSGTIHPFHKSHTTVIGHFHEEFRSLLSGQSVRLASCFIILNLLVIVCLTSWTSSTNSLVLRSYNYITMFELLGLLTYLVSAWSIMQDQKNKATSNSKYTLGFERVEVLAVFSSVVVAQLGAIFIMKDALERFIEQPEVHAGRLLPGALLAFTFHVAVNYFIVNHAFQSICEVASSSWIQEHIADMSRGVCGIVPLLGSFLLPRINPFLLISFAAGCGVLLIDVILQIDSYYIADTLMGLLTAVIIFGTMWPITVCSGRVLLHTTPPHVLGQLDKLLSEAQTLDGVLEIRSEKFYTLSMGLSAKHSSGRPGLLLAGSLRVRVRRDANEQMVLAHVTNRLSPLVPLLTVQVDKDDWINSSPNMGPGSIPVKLSNKATPHIHHHNFSSTTSHYISGFNKPAAAVAPYLQTPPRRPPSSPPARSVPTGSLEGVSKPHEQKDDFSFISPGRTTSSTTLPLIKPRTTQTDIARMYKAAGFTNLPNKSTLGVHSSSFSSFKSGKQISFPSSASFESKFTTVAVVGSNSLDKSKMLSSGNFTANN